MKMAIGQAVWVFRRSGNHTHSSASGWEGVLRPADDDHRTTVHDNNYDPGEPYLHELESMQAAGAHSHDIIIEGAANETRPENAYVNYIIKAKP